MINVESMDHIGIIVSDATKAANWYKSSAGYEEKGSFLLDGSKVIFVYEKNSNVMLELIQRPEGSEEAKLAEKQGWIDHIAFSVSNLEKEFLKAKEENLFIIEGICNIPGLWENGFSYFLLRSPTGEKIEYCKKH